MGTKILPLLLTLTLAIVIVAIVLSYRADRRSQGTSFESMELAFPGGWKQLPDWAAEDLPFDPTQYYGIPDEGNREQLYLKALLKFSFREGAVLIPNRKKYDDELEKRFEEDRRNTREFDEFYDRFLETPRSKRNQAMMDRGWKSIQQFQPGIEYLKLAQKRPHCFFHVKVDTDSFLPHLARDSARMLSVECNHDLNSKEAIESLEMGLQIEQDLRPLGEMITQLGASGIEGICIDEMALPILNHQAIETQQLDQLVRVLKLHRDSIARRDSFLEAARYEHLMFKRLFHELETNTYLPREYAEELWGDEDLPRSFLVLRELTQFKFYGANSKEVEKMIDEMAAENQELAQAAKDAREAAKDLPDPSALDSMALGPRMFKTFQTMTTADYAFEMKVLTTRYKQVEAAVNLPFPESTKTLLELEQAWTTDDFWKSTKILKWFSPHKKLVSVRVRRHLRTGALLCLAAVRKWQLDNDGANPINLKQALMAAGIQVSPIDPHSGKSFNYVAGEQVLVYSVGPDGKDDRAKQQVEYWVTSPDEKGDIVFEVAPLH